MTLRVDRRPRAPGQRGDRQCGRLGTGLRRSFAGRAEIASDCEIRRPERQAMITVVVNNDGSGRGAGPPCMRGGLPWPHLQRPIKDPTWCARSMPEVAAKPMPRRATSRRVSFHQSRAGMSGREIVSAAFCRSGTFLSSVIRETRSAATFVAPQHRDSDRAPARPGLRHRGERLGLGDITQPAVRVPFP